VRNQAGELRAYFNVCRHRGTRICWQESGRFSETIQCPYHAWTYTVDEGQLIGAPHMQEAAGFDKRLHGLHRAHIAEWEGFLFVNVSEDAQPFEQAFAPMIGRLSRFELPKLAVGHYVRYEVKANWKLVFENYSECLHCPTIHPELTVVLPYQSGANDLVEGPFLGGYMEIRPPHESATMSGRACGRLVSPRLEGSDDAKRAYYYSLMPNMLLSLHPDYMMVHTLWPQAPNRTINVCEWHFHPSAMAREGFSPDDAVDFWDLPNRQDWHVCELSQAGISSRAYTPGPYSNREDLLYAFDQMIVRLHEDHEQSF